MSDEYLIPSSARSFILDMKNACIDNIFRCGYYNEEYFENIRSRLGESATFRSLDGLLCLGLNKGCWSSSKYLAVSQIEQNNSVNLKLIDGAWINACLVEETRSRYKFEVICFDQKYGDLKFEKYLGKPINHVYIIKQDSGNLKHVDCANEVGLLVQFEGISPGIAIGANIAPYGGQGCVMLILEDEIDRDWLVDYELVAVF